MNLAVPDKDLAALSISMCVFDDRVGDNRPPLRIEGKVPHAFQSCEPCARNHFSELLPSVERNDSVAGAMNHQCPHLNSQDASATS